MDSMKQSESITQRAKGRSYRIRRRAATLILTSFGAVLVLIFGYFALFLSFVLPGLYHSRVSIGLIIGIVTLTLAGYTAGSCLLCSSYEKLKSLRYAASGFEKVDGPCVDRTLLRGSEEPPVPTDQLLRASHFGISSPEQTLLRSAREPGVNAESGASAVPEIAPLSREA